MTDDGCPLVNEQIKIISSHDVICCCYLINMQIASNLNTLGKIFTNHTNSTISSYVYNTNVNCQIISNREFSRDVHLYGSWCLFTNSWINQQSCMHLESFAFISVPRRKSTLKISSFQFFTNVSFNISFIYFYT